MEFEARLQDALLKAIRTGLIGAAHDVSDGGLGITLAEMAMFSGLGAQLTVDGLGKGAIHETLFSEAQSGVVIGVYTPKIAAVEAHFKAAGVPVYMLGHVGGSYLDIEGASSWEVSALDARYQQSLPEMMSATIIA
jgi:phosphoribosylformylglycinamidine synthase